jgi:alpha-L-rhamnosidase
MNRGVIFWCVGFLLISVCSAADRPPDYLRCELMTKPHLTCITDLQPEFSWQMPATGKGARQTAWQVILSADSNLVGKGKGDWWDSGRVESDESVDIEYAGRPLTAPGTLFWRVRIWNQEGQVSPFSTIQKIRVTRPDSNAFSRENKIWSNRYPLQKQPRPAMRFVKKRTGAYFIDFSRAAFGTVEISRLQNRSGNITVHLGEVLAGPDSVHRHPGGSRRYRSWQQPINGHDPLTLTVPADHRNTHGQAVLMPAEIGEVLPFRYCELENVPEEISADQVSQIAVQHPFAEKAASFHSSNRILNDVWQMCQYSMQATSFLGVYVDGDRERIPYEGDAYINQLGHYAVDAEYSLARYSIEYLFHHPTWPAEWQMHMPLMVWADYLYTGNRELLSRYYDDLIAKSLIGLSRADGLIVEDSVKMTPAFLQSLHLQTAPRILVDWPPASFSENRYGERDQYDMRPVNTVANAFHYHCLNLLSRMAETLGKTEDAAHWRERSRLVYRSFQNIFFDAEKRRYRDGEGSAHSALHANFFPLMFGLVPPEQIPGVVDFIKSRGMACSVYGSQYLLEALYQVGEEQYALSLLTAVHDRSWAHMIYDVGSTITTEAWDNKYKPNQDWNHAWGGAPANLIPRCLMGIEPLEPGCKKIRIRPQIADLDFAEITTPTIRGEVQVKVEQRPRLWQAHITLPANMTAELHLPAVAREQVHGLDPKVIGLVAGRLVLELSAGRYFVQVTDPVKYRPSSCVR